METPQASPGLQVGTDLPSIGVVIIGRNEGERLRRCLDSIRAADYPADKLEVVYVDSNSSDGSVALARSLGATTLVLDGPTTAARGRNAGWTTLSTPFVLFLDGDTILDPTFLRAALASMAEPAVAGVWGNRRELDTAGSVYNAIFDLDWGASPGPSLYHGGDALVRVDALRAVNGYNASLIAGEEPDMCRRMRGLGYLILHIDAPMTLHDLDMHRFRQYWRRQVRTGYAYAEISSFYARTSDPLWLDKSRRNVIRGLLWTGVPLLALIVSAIFRSPWPIVAFLVIAALLIGRTTLNVRSKTPTWGRRIAYGLHSHLQQVPILLGQIRFWMIGRGRSKATLIEYKT